MELQEQIWEAEEYGRSHRAGFGLVELFWGECWGLLVGIAGAGKAMAVWVSPRAFLVPTKTKKITTCKEP